MEAPSPSRSARPQNIRSLVEQAENFTFNTNIPFKHWTRAAETLRQEASFAISDGDFGRAYMMLYRHSVLVLKSLPTHPQFRKPEGRATFKPLSNHIDSVLSDLENIKPVVEEEFAAWERVLSAAPNLGEHRPSTTAPSSYADFAARDPSLGGRAQVLDASENQDLAVDLAQKELARRDNARRVCTHPRTSQQQNLTALDDSKFAHEDSRNRTQGQDGMQRTMEEARRALRLGEHIASDQGRMRDRDSAQQAKRGQYTYPSISKSKPVEYGYSRPQKYPLSMPGPSRPPKEHLSSPGMDDGLVRGTTDIRLPNLSGRSLAIEDGGRFVPTAPSAPTDKPPVLPRGSLNGPPLPRKERLSFKPGGYLENGDPIRSVFIPSSLRTLFLDIASENTKAGLEMCGILCGTPVNNALFVRCLLIPEQKCTSDTCETVNEGAIFDYCAGEDLLVLGWIHTHPTQTCFMSSRDLHTHAGYQVMMPESIAIVCAPRFKPSYGIFRLTHPPGLDYILDCKRHDTFHRHSIDNIYQETEHPYGHVYESDKMPLYVHDLRLQ